MYSEIRISNKTGVAVIDIEGVIGVPENMQFDKAGDKVATYSRFTEALDDISALDAHEVVVNIRSTGGDVNDALLIYETLSALDARVITRCYGYVASAATIIAQAASKGCREISSSTLYLIHCSESAAEGNSGSMSRTKDLLDKTDARIASIYALRSSRPADGFAELMNENGGKGRWLSAHEAVDAGLADKVIEPLRVENSAREDALMAALGAMAAVAGITLTPELGRLALEHPDGSGLGREYPEAGAIGEARIGEGMGGGGRAQEGVDGTQEIVDGTQEGVDGKSVLGKIADRVRGFFAGLFEVLLRGHELPPDYSGGSAKSGRRSGLRGRPEEPEQLNKRLPRGSAAFTEGMAAAEDPTVAGSASGFGVGSGGPLSVNGIMPVDNALQIRLRTAQAAAAPTRTLPREDPPIGEARRNTNDAAYMQDAMSFRKS